MKQKPIIIWWGVDTSEKGFEEGIRAEEPIPILKKFLVEYAGKDNDTKALSYCPALLNEVQNVYGVKPYYDYNINVDSKGYVSTDDYDQKFYDTHIHVRSDRLISFRTNHIFFAPYEKSLLFSQTNPFFEDNDMSNNALLIPGQFDIAKYFRSVDCAFIVKKSKSTMKFLRNEICFYIRFHTTRPIIFKQFFWDKKINDYYHPMMAVKNHKYSSNPKDQILSYYYKLFHKFQFKKKLIKIIENNLIKNS